MTTTPATADLRHQAGTRTQYVFVYPCGCPRTVIEGSSVAGEAEAWAEAAPLKAERRWLDRQGVRLLHIAHAEYLERFAEKMRVGCPHPRDDR